MLMMMMVMTSQYRSVFPISFDCLYSQDCISKDVVGTAEEAEGNVVIGKSCDVGRDRAKSHGDLSNVVGSLSSSSTLRQQKRRPKHKRHKTSALAPTPTQLPCCPDLTGP